MPVLSRLSLAAGEPDGVGHLGERAGGRAAGHVRVGERVAVDVRLGSLPVRRVELDDGAVGVGARPGAVAVLDERGRVAGGAAVDA
jgi:hypothetical protein